MAKALANFNLMAHVASRRNHSRPSLSYRPMMVTMSMSQYKNSYWTSIHEDIEAYLKQNVVVKEPAQVFEPMHHFVFAAPVNTAAALCIAACEFVGGQREQAMAAAAALHVMYAASVTHEDLPLSVRRSLIPKSKPMKYHAFNPNVELLIVDGMIPFALELLANSENPVQNNSDRILRAIVEMTRAFGSQGLIEGQYYELQCSQNYYDNEMIIQAYEKKEGGLHACGGACGAILGGGSEEEIEALIRYGFYVGMIQAMSQRLGLEKEVEELKNLAMKEIKSFNQEKFDVISSFVKGNFSFV